MKQKNIFSFITTPLLTLTILAGLSFFISFSAYAETRYVIGTGNVGSILWTMYSDGALQFTGSGVIPDYNFEEAQDEGAPEWVRKHHTQISSVYIDNRITGIGDGAFQDCGFITSVTIPESVTEIGEDAFLYVDNAEFKVVSGSTAHEYAKKYGYKITLIQKEASEEDVTLSSKTSIISVYNIKSKTAQLKWKRRKSVTGYQIQYAASADFSDAGMKSVGKNKTTSKSIGGLSNNNTWYFRIRTYKKTSGKKIYSKWSKAVKKKIVSSSYDSKVYTFTHKKRYKHGAVWRAAQRPLISRFGGIGCCAYAADFHAYMTGKKKDFGKKTFKSVKKIKAGDVIKVLNKQHWFVVLYRKGNKLTTAEGNWGGKVVISDSAYTIKGNRLYRNGKKFRTFSIGYHLK